MPPETPIKRTVRMIRNNASLHSIIASLREPQRLRDFYRSIRYGFRKNRLDLEEERNKRPEILSNLFGVNIAIIKKYQAEVLSNTKFRKGYRERRDELRKAGEISGVTPEVEGVTLYCIVRLLKPDVIIQTGSQYEGFGAFICRGLCKNGKGTLHSIDLPKQVSEEFNYGHLIEPKDRECYQLHLGNAKAILPELLSDKDSIDIFIHDSLHKREHMKWEYETAFPYVRSGGIIASHDIIKNNAFSNFVCNYNLENDCIYTTGISIKR